MARRELEGLSFFPIDPNNPVTTTMNSNNALRSNVLGASSADSVISSSSASGSLTPNEGSKTKKKTKKSLKERIRWVNVISEFYSVVELL